MAPSTPLIASIIGEPGVVIALITGAFALGARAFPKTRSEAGVDRATERKSDAESWDLLVKNLREDLAGARDDVAALRDRVAAAETVADEARNALEEERRECDRQIQKLLDRVIALEEAGGPQRVWFRE